MRSSLDPRLAPATGLVTVDPLHDPAWLRLCERAPNASIFHHPAWLGLVHDRFGYPIWAWCVTGEDGSLAAGIPVALLGSRLTGARLVSMPFSDSCQPLADPAAGTDLAPLAVGVERASQQLRLPHEVRGALRGSADGTLVERYVQHELALQADADLVAAGFTRSQVQRGAAKARREGVTIERRTDRESLDRFYRLHTLTRRHHGVPTQPRRFILRFADLFEQGLGFVLLARHEDRDIAAAVFLTAWGRLTYKFGASDRRFLAKRPNNLLFVDAIRWGCEHDQRVLDFGRSDHSGAGLRAFKRSFGAAEDALEYTYLNGYPPPSAEPSLAQRSLSAAIRRTPPSFGRLAGRLLYRHYG